MFWHEFLHMVTDPAHWAFEFSVGTIKDLLLLFIGSFVGRKWLRRHDKEHHSN